MAAKVCLISLKKRVTLIEVEVLTKRAKNCESFTWLFSKCLREEILIKTAAGFCYSNITDSEKSVATT